ncbi:hypothetical protein [Aurantiacibacter aquimixticola]|nr:hypothetical protein [Aurantiacibacter aquimixticola]
MDNNEKKPGADKQQQQGGQKPPQADEKGKGRDQKGDHKSGQQGEHKK